MVLLQFAKRISGPPPLREEGGVGRRPLMVPIADSSNQMSRDNIAALEPAWAAKNGRLLSVLLQPRQAEGHENGNDQHSYFLTDGIPCCCWLHAFGHCHVHSFDQQAFESLRLGGGELVGGPQQIRPASKQSAEQT